MRILHTADWQLGRVFRQLGQQAEKLREARLETVATIIALASREKVDAVVAAGDLLEDNQVEFRWVEGMAERLRASAVPIYLLPGNHDPLTQDSPYLLHPELFGSPVVLLGTAAPVPMANGQATLFPCPAMARCSRRDPTAWIPTRVAGDGLRIGVAHGPQEHTPDDAGYHIPKDAAERLGLDYLALGHWHGTKQITARTWYSGTPEETAFDEGGGNVLLVEIEGAGATPQIRQIPVNTYHWLDRQCSIHDPQDVDTVRGLLEQLANRNTTLLRLRLDGTLPAAELARLDPMLDDFAARYLHLRVENHLTVLDSSPPAYRNPLLREMHELLTAELSKPEPAEGTRRALSMLVSLVRECGDLK